MSTVLPSFHQPNIFDSDRCFAFTLNHSTMDTKTIQIKPENSDNSYSDSSIMFGLSVISQAANTQSQQKPVKNATLLQNTPKPADNSHDRNDLVKNGMDAEILHAANLLFNSFSSPSQKAAPSSSSSSSSPSPIYQPVDRKRSFRETLLSLDSTDSDNHSDGDDSDWDGVKQPSVEYTPKKSGTPTTTRKRVTQRKPVLKKKVRKVGASDSPGSAATDGESGGNTSSAGTLVYGRVCSFCGATQTPMWRHGLFYSYFQVPLAIPTYAIDVE